MLILRLPKETSFIRRVASKYKRQVKRGLLLGEIAYSDISMYLLMPEEALSSAFIYSVYLNARIKKISVNAMYATSIDIEKILPEEVKKVGRIWASKKLPKSEIKLLKNKLITSDILRVILT